MRTEAAAIQIDTSLQLSVDFCNRSRPPLKRQKYVDRGSIPNQLCRFPLDLASSFCQRGGMGELRTERKKERELPPDLGHRYLAHPPTFSLDEQAPLTERSKHILPTSLSLHPLIEEQTSLIERSTSCLKEPQQKPPLFLLRASIYLLIEVYISLYGSKGHLLPLSFHQTSQLSTENKNGLSFVFA